MMDEILEEMIDPAPAREDVLRRRRLWATGAILVLAGVGVTSLTTAAVFTDQDTASGRITTGSVQLAATPGASGSVAFALPPGGIAPGGFTVAPVTVTNEGSLELRYAISVSATAPEVEGKGDLRERLRLRVYALPEAACTLDGFPQDAQPIGDTGEGRLLGTATPVVGSPAVGYDASPGGGDRTLHVAGTSAVSSETLCFRLDMADADQRGAAASGADNAYQDTSADVIVQIDSEQTVNN